LEFGIEKTAQEVKMDSADIVVVGGGLVGLAFACALKDSGLRVTLIEGQHAPSSSEHPNEVLVPETAAQLVSGYSPRVSAINMKSRAFLSRIGGWPLDSERYADYDEMAVWDTQGTAAIRFSAAEVQQDCLGTIIENASIISQLYSTALLLENVDLIFGVALESIQKSDDGYLVRLNNGREIQCQLLVGADGGQSRVRELADLRSVDWSYHQSAVVTTVEIDRPHGNTARQWFTAQGPLAFLPLANPNYCSIVWSSTEAERILALDNKTFCDQLSQIVGKQAGSVVSCDQRFSFPLTQRHAVQYARENLVLIGDAAHTIHPLAGQGVNLGFADAQTLAQTLHQCRFESLSPGDLTLLKRFENRRKPENILMAAVMEGFKRLFGSDDPGIRWLRNTGLRMVNSTGALKTMAAKLATGA
jgi:2-octaprenylphenol hydroxylase